MLLFNLGKDMLLNSLNKVVIMEVNVKSANIIQVSFEIY